MIVAIHAGKGGVGASTVAYNLGAALDAVVVDADLGMADLPAGTRGPDLHDVLAGRATPIEAVRESGPVALLPCGRSLAGARAADGRRLPEALTAVTREYGWTVVDCPAGLAPGAGLPLVAADASVLVTTPREVALAGTVRVRALARELETGLAATALNRTGSDPPVDRVAELLGVPVVAVPESTAVGRAIADGRPADGSAGTAFERLATAVRTAAGG